MTQSERVSELFRRIRDWHVDNLGMHITDAAADLQEFMRQCCREWNNKTYEWEDISDTKTLELLRQKFREDKKWLRSQKHR